MQRKHTTLSALPWLLAWGLLGLSGCSQSTPDPVVVVFESEELTFEIHRDYDQHVAVWVENRSGEPHRVIAEIDGLDNGLLGGFSGLGTAQSPRELDAGERKQMRLSLFAQDASPGAHLLRASLKSAEDGTLLSEASIKVIIRSPLFSLEVEVGSQDPATLARSVDVRNLGEVITDFTVVAGDELNGHVTFAPRVDHARLWTGRSMSFEVQPILSTAFEKLNGAVILRGAGQSQIVPLTFELPPGKRVFVATSFTTGNEESEGGYCTNNPNTDTEAGGPDCGGTDEEDGDSDSGGTDEGDGDSDGSNPTPPFPPGTEPWSSWENLIEAAKNFANSVGGSVATPKGTDLVGEDGPSVWKGLADFLLGVKATGELGDGAVPQDEANKNYYNSHPRNLWRNREKKEND